MSLRKVGGLTFISLGAFRVSFCRVSAPKPVASPSLARIRFAARIAPRARFAK